MFIKTLKTFFYLNFFCFVLKRKSQNTFFKIPIMQYIYNFNFFEMHIELTLFKSFDVKLRSIV